MVAAVAGHVEGAAPLPDDGEAVIGSGNSGWVEAYEYAVATANEMGLVAFDPQTATLVR
jgi:hypothetical protein